MEDWLLAGEGEAAGVEGSEVEMAMGAGGCDGKEACPHHDLACCRPPEAPAVNSADIPYHAPGTRGRALNASPAQGKWRRAGRKQRRRG